MLTKQNTSIQLAYVEEGAAVSKESNAFLCKEEYGICVLPGSTLDLEQTVLYSDLIKQKDFHHVLHDGDSQLMLSEML